MRDTPNEAVAIIGMAGRFPGAGDTRAFWRNVLVGADCITRETAADAPDTVRQRSWIVGAGGVLDDIETFDAEFFGIAPIEAAWMDPQHRLFLETVWLALEDAGKPPAAITCPVAIYAGTNFNSYLPPRLDLLAEEDAARVMQVLIGNEKDFLTTRVSYKLNLTGESVTVQTSCSTSLVAVHLACQSLLIGQSDMALAGGVSIRVPQRASYRYEAGMIASPDGHCRPFDRRASGTVPGNGVGVVVLKRLDDALADRDHCYAVIRGSWINNDGRAKVGFTAPSVDGQSTVVARAMAIAGVDPRSITYIETHGTGTPVGDPIEVEALTRAFGQEASARRVCALGAVKSSIGHLDTAAGVAGLIKATLAIHHGWRPPATYFAEAHPALDLASSPFYVNTHAEQWPTPGPRRAGVSGFGVGGTNAHLVLEEAPPRRRTMRPRSMQVVTLSGKTAAARDTGALALAGILRETSSVELRDVAYTYNVCRTAFAHRRFAVGATAAELAAAFDVSAGAGALAATRPAVVFLFPGQGAQSVGMARALYQEEPIVRQAIDLCLEEAERLGCPLRDVLFGDLASEAHRASMRQPVLALPALFAVEYALAELWRAWGVVPDIVLGHSYGELVAAAVAGVFSMRDAVAIAVARGRLMGRLPPGAMLAVPMSAEEVAPLLDDDLEIAAINGHARTVVSGPHSAVTRLEASLDSRGVRGRRLEVECAYHSRNVEPVMGEYADLLGRLPRYALRMRCLSNRTGDWLTDAESRDPAYWADQMRQPVRFADCLQRCLDLGRDLCLVEVGPGQTLTMLARRALAGRAVVVPSLGSRPGADHDWRALLTAAGELWCRGVPVDWMTVERHQEGWSTPLPGYAFERQRHWIELARGRPRASDAGLPSVDEAAAPTDAVTSFVPKTAPALTEAAGVAGPRHTDARMQLEETLAAIWAEVLGRPSIGRREQFFELGGDSLAAIRVRSRLSQWTGLEPSLEQLLTNTTIETLAAALSISDAAVDAQSPIAPATDVGERAQLLSVSQEWFWAQHEAAPASAVYHLPVVLRLSGDFEARAFVGAVASVAVRHEVLRTTFSGTHRGAAARVCATPSRTMLVDVANLAADVREACTTRIVRRLMTRPFRMAVAPPWRSCVVRLAADEHVAVFVLHHIISDAWSTNILVEEVSAAYQALLERRPWTVGPLAVQYADYARRQREALERSGDDLVSYWRQQMAGVPPLLSLSPRPRPAIRQSRGARRGFAIGAHIASRLSELGRVHDSTLFMVLLSAFEALLFRITTQEEFCVGVPTAGRLAPEYEPLIGCFMNTLPIRARVRADAPFVEHLHSVRAALLAAYAHQALPFGRIVQESKAPRALDHTPLFQVLFDLLSMPRTSIAAAPDGPNIEPFAVALPTAKSDLVVDLWPATTGALQGSVEYDIALFDEEDVAALIDGFEAVLEAIAADPAHAIALLPVESEGARLRRRAAAAVQHETARQRLREIQVTRRTGRSAVPHV